MNKLSEYHDYIQNDTIKIEDQYKDLILYRGFCTLTWNSRYFLVLRDNILVMSEEYPYGEFETAKSVYEVLLPSNFDQCRTDTDNNKKCLFKISFDSAKGVTEGLVKLTKNEASIVEFAMDVDNWINLESDAYGAGGSIDVEHPVECEER